MSSLLLFFAHSMQVKVPEGTVLCFNPLSLSPDELSALPDIQVCVGGSITFQTKQAVLDKVSPAFFDAQHSFESQTRRGQGIIIAAPIKQMIIENNEGLAFFSLLFDYLRRKYDHDYSNANDNDNNDNDNDNNDNDNANANDKNDNHDDNDNNDNDNDNDNNDNYQQNAASKAVIPYTRHLSPAQLHHFQQVCDYWIPGMFHNNNNELNQEEEEEDSITVMMMPLLVGCLDMTQEHEMAQLLAKKKSFGGFCHTEELTH